MKIWVLRTKHHESRHGDGDNMRLFTDRAKAFVQFEEVTEYVNGAPIDEPDPGGDVEFEFDEGGVVICLYEQETEE